MEIWATQIGVAQQALASVGLTASDVAAIGIANQRETVVLWDRKSGLPVAPAIVWQDRRTAPECDRLRAEGLEPLVQSKTGLLLDAYFSATKLAWLLDHVPDARRRAKRGELAFGTVDAWLLLRLTGEHATDVTNASRTLLWNLHTQTWDDELLTLFRIPREVLPRVHASSGVFGETSPGLLGSRLTVASMAGDQQAALFGQACLEPGMAKNTYGTGCFVLLRCGDRPIASHARMLSTAACQVGARPSYALEGSIFVAGAAVQWLRDGLGIVRSSEEVEALAGSVPDSGGVVVVPAFVGLGAPHWDSYARGSIHGLTRGTTRAHLARATLESIALQSLDVLQAMARDGGEVRELRVDGGAARNDLLMQMQADLLGVPVVRPEVTETTALGAAYLAGLAVGVWPDVSEVARRWRPERVFEPKLPPDERAERVARWHKAIDRTKGWASE